MAVYEDSEFLSPRTPSMASVTAHRFVDFIGETRRYLRFHIVRSQTRSALSKLSNRQLADIGISRAEIAEFSTRAARR